VTRSLVENILSLLLLGSFIWCVQTLIPRATRERDTLAIVCAAAAALVAFLAWLLLGSGVRSG
jgi:hypothetical protein